MWTFRPEKNAARLNRSAHRMALPQLPEETFIESLKQLVQVDEKWVPSGEGEAFYFRPFMIATEAYLGVRPARHVEYHVMGRLLATTSAPPSRWISGCPRSMLALVKAVLAPQNAAVTMLPP